MNIFTASAAYNYGEALQKSIFFYECQRSGNLDESTLRMNWRGDSGMRDGSDVGLDLTGGWYDAGDHVKFGLPMAYTATQLGWAVYEYRSAFENSGQLNYILENIKWATDYMIKCHPSPNVFYYQVGSGSADHAWWGPAEVMQMARPSYKVDTANPGSAVVGETAAALACASVIFKTTNPTYSATCLAHAKDLFAFADATRSDAGYTAASGYYNSWSGWWDELSWAATWLYLATNDAGYLAKAESYVANWGKEPQTTTIAYKWGHAWDDVHYGAELLLAKITDKQIYKDAIEMHLDYWTTGYNGTRINYTPGGLAYLDTWGSLRYATTTAFLACVYSDWPGRNISKGTTYLNFAKSQVDYALGSNPRNSSYVVGFGANPPQHPHHRTAHSSWADSQSVPAYHRHVLYGALVGGPNSTDAYNDSISDYVCNEVATDYNAGFTGALAKMYALYGGAPIANFKSIEAKSNDEYFVEAGVNSSGTNYTEIKALLNNRSGWPAKVGDKLFFRYFMDFTEVFNAGYTVNDLRISTNYNQGAIVSAPRQWSGNIYYVVVDFTGTPIYPGGQSAYRKEVQFRISAPDQTSFWNPNNDYSYQGLTGGGSAVQTVYIPVYDNGVRVYGSEPGNGMPPPPPTSTPTATPTVTSSTAVTPTNTATATITATPINSPTASATVIPTASGGSVVTAKKTLLSLTVDGNLSETVWSINTGIAKAIIGTPNNTASFGALWDASNLYVGVKVTDSSLRNDSANAWDDDSVEIYIDANHNHGASYDTYDRQYVKGWNDSGVWEKSGKTAGVLHGWAAVTGGYSVEASVPWSNLEITAAAGATIGLDIGINDDDNGSGRESQSMWAGANNNWTDTSAFGDCYLSGETVGGGTPTPTATPTNTPTSSIVSTNTPTASIIPTNTPTATPTATPSSSPAGGMSLKYRCGDPSSPGDNQIKPHFMIVNVSGAPVPMSELKIRYWYTIDSDKPQNFWVDYATKGNGNVAGAFVKLGTARTGADYYLEVSFAAAAGSIADNSDSGEIQTRFAKNDWSSYNETGDHSYDPAKTGYSAWNRVTLYRNGVLVYGIEP
ncbi:MAG: glycoside hydrolase family 9 protein [Bacillota bacterium]